MSVQRYQSLAWVLNLTFALVTSAALAQTSDTRKLETVEVAGIGKTVAEARNDGLRQAVQRVVGVYVDNKRRIEIKMTDKQLLEKIEEHILSYTNAYVDKIDIVGVSDKSGFVEIRLRVTVVVKALVDRLGAVDVPVVPFDTKSAEASVSTAGQEREGAYTIYKSLVTDFDKLIRYEVKSSRVDVETPALPGNVWIRLDTDFVVDGSQVRRWREAFKTFGTSRFEGTAFATKWPYLSPEGSRVGSQPQYCFLGLNSPTFHSPDISKTQAVCDAVSGLSSSNTVSLQCRGRAFPEKNFLEDGERLGRVINSKAIRAEFRDAAGDTVFLHRFRYGNTRQMETWLPSGVLHSPNAPDGSSVRTGPHRNAMAFASSCSMKPLVLGGYQNVMFLPASEIRIRGLFMFQVPEEVAKKIASISVTLTSE